MERGPDQRRYGGLSREQRRAERRNRLLVSGFELFGTDGFLNTSIERLCNEAQVSTRYFYEEFSSRDAILHAVLVDQLEQAAEVCRRAVEGDEMHRLADPVAETRRQVARFITAYVGFLTSDPRRLQIIHRESKVVRSPLIARPALQELFGESMWHVWLAGLARTSPDRYWMHRDAVRGALNEVLLQWLAKPHPRPPVEPLARRMSHLVALTIGAAHLAPQAP